MVFHRWNFSLGEYWIFTIAFVLPFGVNSHWRVGTGWKSKWLWLKEGILPRFDSCSKLQEVKACMDSKLHVASLQVFEWFIKFSLNLYLLIFHLSRYFWKRVAVRWEGGGVEKGKKKGWGIKIMYDSDDVSIYSILITIILRG